MFVVVAFSVLVTLVVRVDKADAVAVTPVELSFTVFSKFVIAVPWLVLVLLIVIIELWALAIAPVSVVPVKLLDPTVATRVASLDFSQSLLDELRAYTWLLSSVSTHMSWACRAEPSSLCVGAEVDFITLVEAVAAVLAAVAALLAAVAALLAAVAAESAVD